MDVLYAHCREAPVAYGKKSKKQKVVRTNNSRSSPISGISDDGSVTVMSVQSDRTHPAGGDEGIRDGRDRGGPPVVHGTRSMSRSASPAMTFKTAVSASMTDKEGLTICVECNAIPSNHQCRKCDAIICGVCCSSKRGLEGSWWCEVFFNKCSAKIQKAIRDHKYFSDDDDVDTRAVL